MQAGETEKNVNFCSSFQVGFEGRSKLVLVFVSRALSKSGRIVKLENFPLILTQTVTTSPTETRQLSLSPQNFHKENLGGKILGDDDLMNSNSPSYKRVIDTLHIISVCFVPGIGGRV